MEVGLEILEVELLPDEESPLWHECEDGHHWTEHPDGTVSPSYGLGATRLTWEGYDPRTCPEPEWLMVRNDPPAGQLPLGWQPIYTPVVECPGCGKRALPCDLLPGVSSAPWELEREAEETGHYHAPPTPVCLLPPARTARWVKVKAPLWNERTGKRTPGWTRTWVDLEQLRELGLEVA